MSSGNRLRNYAIGLGVGLLIAAGFGSYFWSEVNRLDAEIQVRADEQASQYSDTAYVATECEPNGVTTATDDQCIEAGHEAARQAQRNERDLEAQQRMALWTRVMGQAAIVGMGVGIIGLALIFTTFWETRKTAISAARSIELQMAQNIIPPEIDIQYILHTEDRERWNPVRISFVARNIGTTHIRSLRYQDVSVAIPDAKIENATMKVLDRARSMVDLKPNDEASVIDFTSDEIFIDRQAVIDGYLSDSNIDIRFTMTYVDALGVDYEITEHWQGKFSPSGSPGTVQRLVARLGPVRRTG